MSAPGPTTPTGRPRGEAAPAAPVDAGPWSPEAARHGDVSVAAELVGTDRLAAGAYADEDAEREDLMALAARDLGAARVLDGHRNAVQRLLRHRPQDVADRERQSVATGALACGVWGADPGPGEGPPAAVHEHADGRLVLDGVKTFCSGAGLVRRALVLVRSRDEGPPTTLVLVGLDEPGTVEIDRSWFASPALASSLSHRVRFSEAPVLAVLGGPGALAEEPWISRDALRTAATWCGALRGIADGVLAELALRPPGDHELARAGRLDRLATRARLWLDRAGERVDAEAAHEGAAAAVRAARLEIAEAAQEGIGLAAELSGSRPLVAGAPWASARLDLDLLLRQHRLGPVAVRAGQDALAGQR